jgi:hypothetical protein
MTSAAATLKSAVESGDFLRAQTALDLYVASFRSCDRSLGEVTDALHLIDRSLSAALTQRATLAGDQARLRNLQGGYRLPRISTTWQLEG